MKKLSLALSLLYGTSLLHGCTSFAPETSLWTVEPVERVRHATHRPDGYYQLGRYYQGQNRLELAAGAYRKAIEVDPNFVEAHNGLGTVHAAQGRYKQALAAFNVALTKAPAAAHIHNNIGYLNFLEGHYAEAVTAFKQATALDPSNRKAWTNLDMALARTGQSLQSREASAAVDGGTSAAPQVAQVSSIPAAAVAAHVEQAANLGVADTRRAMDHLRTHGEFEQEKAVRITASSAPEAPVRVDAVADPVMVRVLVPNEQAVRVVHASERPRAIVQKAAELVSTSQIGAPTTVARVGASSIVATTGAVTGNGASGPQSIPVTSAPESFEGVAFRVASLPRRDADADAKARNFVFEVSNGNGIHRLAARFGTLLSAKGLPRARLTNTKPFNQTRTVIYYRAGYASEAARLGKHLKAIHGQVVMMETRNRLARADVKLVLGKDVSGTLRGVTRSAEEVPAAVDPTVVATLTP
jgi:tetratricopeptide (TPR) repeat protein